MSSRSTSARLNDILRAIQSIQASLIHVNFESFCENETLVKAILYDLIIIGEAANKIPAKIQALAPNIPWRLMGDMRNIMAHEYFQVDLQITWSTVRHNLPPLIPLLQELQTSLNHDPFEDI